MSIEEYGPGDGDFEGVPGTMVKHWAEYERSGVDFACLGIYNNGGLLGNVMRHAWDTNALPNGGWRMMNWYRQMQGEYVPVSRWSTRYYQAFDGVASWNATNQTLTLILGGSDDNAEVRFLGLGTLGIGNTVRVRLDLAMWTVNSDAWDKTVERGGDPQSGPINLLDRNFTLDASGNLTVPVRRVERYNGYRIQISPSNSPAVYPTKYEAEDSTYNHVVLHNGADGKFLSSGGAYIGGIDFADSYLRFRVNAPSNGLYQMLVRYACNTNTLPPASQFVTVNGQSQGVVNYSGTTAWANSEMRFASKLISLRQGTNDVMLSYATNYAEIDFIDVRPNTHRYDAEFAQTNHANLGRFTAEIITPNYVGGIDFADSFVDFKVTVPVSGRYFGTVAYANGTAGSSTHLFSVNGVGQGSVSYVASGGWFGNGNGPNGVRRFAAVPLMLNAGTNSIRFNKGASYAELDYLTVTPTNNLTPPRPTLSIGSASNAAIISWAAPALGYGLQRNLDMALATWSNVSNTVTEVNGRKQVTISPVSGNAFFRLYP